MNKNVLMQGATQRCDALAIAHAKQDGYRLDSFDPGTGIYFQRQLEYIYPEVLRTNLPALNALKFFPMDTEVDAGAETFTHRIVEPLGIAEWISDEADDLPFADVAAQEQQFKLKSCGAAFKYSIFDILRGQMTGMKLDIERGLSARRAVEEKQNRTFWFGDDSVGIFGVCNFPYAPRYLFSDPISGATAADTIINQLNLMVANTVTLTKNTEKPNTLLLATSPYSHIAATPRSATSDTTILQFFLTQNPYIERVESVHELEGAGDNGEHLAVAYTPNKRTSRLVVAQPFTMLPAEARNLAFVTNTYSKIGGFASMYPLAMVVGEIPIS